MFKKYFKNMFFHRRSCRAGIKNIFWSGLKSAGDAYSKGETDTLLNTYIMTVSDSLLRKSSFR